MSQSKCPVGKRVQFFKYQFLDEEDFRAEQKYHIDSRRLHNRTLHTWGIADGLGVERDGPKKIVIHPGSAIDAKGQEIRVNQNEAIDLSDLNEETEYHLTVSYEEGYVPEDLRNLGESTQYARTTEFAVIEARNESPSPDGIYIPLAKLRVNRQGEVSIDRAVRKAAGAMVPPSSITTEQLADASVTREKLNPKLRTGWVRLPFKPFAIPNERMFRIGVTEAECDSDGAWGTMSIPVPPHATRIVAFRIVGQSDPNTKGVRLQLWRCGWNANTNKKVEDLLLKDRWVKGQPYFDQKFDKFDLEQSLDSATHGLALFVEATGQAKIWLIATQFD